MRGDLCLDFERVYAFVAPRAKLFRTEGAQAIGWEVDGVIVAGVVYDGFNGNNVFMHVAAIDGASWLTRKYLKACFLYPFEQLKVSRITGFVEASNFAARKFDEHLGFTKEAVLKGAASDGGDVILYVMRREGCRYV